MKNIPFIYVVVNYNTFALYIAILFGKFVYFALLFEEGFRCFFLM